MKKSFVITLSILLLFAYETAYAVNCKNCLQSLTGNYQCVFESGSTYTGALDSQCRFTYKGERVYKSGNVYTGDWLQGKRHGKGSYTYSDLSNVDVFIWWEGKWNMGKRSYGTFYGKGFLITGKYKDGEQDGVHIYEYTSGEHFGRQVEKIYKNGNFVKNGKVLRTAEEARRQWQERARVKKKQEEEAKVRKTIYNNCLLDKSKGVDMDVKQIRQAAEDTCESIADSPSYWESFKYK